MAEGPSTPQWQTVSQWFVTIGDRQFDDGTVRRLAVPGGWLYQTKTPIRTWLRLPNMHDQGESTLTEAWSQPVFVPHVAITRLTPGLSRA